MMTKVTRVTRVAAVLMLLGLISAAQLTYADDLALYATLGVTPNRAVMAVQGRLQQAGYYNGPVTGVVDLPTAAAIARFQVKHGFLATGGIDQPTAEALGIQLSPANMGPAIP
jgi:peptidoglycan hydrolase-like protein with peptidoglycan-binding domain